MTNRRNFIWCAMSTAVCISMTSMMLYARALVDKNATNKFKKFDHHSPFPSWLLGETIIFKPTGEEFVICCVMPGTLLVGANNNKLKTLKSTTREILGDMHRDGVTYLDFWAVKNPDSLNGTKLLELATI